MSYDQRKAAYADALQMWKGSLRCHSNWRPDASAFGLSNDEALAVELDGYDTSGLPEHLRWNGKALTDEQYARLDAARPITAPDEAEGK